MLALSDWPITKECSKARATDGADRVGGGSQDNLFRSDSNTCFVRPVNQVYLIKKNVFIVGCRPNSFWKCGNVDVANSGNGHQNGTL